MVTMEYEVFVAQFRARASSRMEEFEKALAKTRQGLDEAKAQVEAPVRQGRPSEGLSVAGTGVVDNDKTQAAQPLLKPVQPARGRTRGRGPVQSILRKA